MQNSNNPIAIIGGYEQISRSFFSTIKSQNNKSIFINVNGKNIQKIGIYNLQIYQLKKILEILKIHKIKDLLFIGKISRPNLSNFKMDGVIDKYMPLLINTFTKGDGKILFSIIEIFTENGFNILSPNKISKSFFLNKDELNSNKTNEDKIDINKSTKILNELSKFDNAQSIVCINGYIIAIEAAEGTDRLLKRTVSVRKELKQIKFKSGILTKVPKKNQSRLIDLPVIGVKTLKLIKDANLNGIAINPKSTIIHNKIKFLEKAREYDLKIYNAY